MGPLTRLRALRPMKLSPPTGGLHEGLGIGVKSLGFEVVGLGFRGLSFRVWGRSGGEGLFGARLYGEEGSGFRLWG